MKKTQKKRINWFVKTALQAAAFIGLFAAVTYPIYRAQKRKLEEADEQV
ncbi:MAG: hypothetical protein AAF738_07360 [Bacteroidota bacterium]